MARLQAQRTDASGLALPLALVYCGLVAYASLYPFVGWQSQGVMPWAFALAPLPRYWTGFDVAINVLGYMPLGALASIIWQSSALASRSRSVWFAAVFACALSFLMEALQTYLAPRVASNVDWGLNTLGGFLGGMLAWMADSVGLLRSWSRFRERRFASGSGFALGLLLLWPLALLYPTPVPLGLGSGLGKWLELGTQVLPYRVESAIILMGLLVPLLISYAVTPKLLHRAITLALMVIAALGVTTLSNGLSFGPAHATVWLHEKTFWGLWVGAGVGVLLLPSAPRLCWVMAFLLLVPQLFILGIMASDPYFTQKLSIWERGQFIRFYGATQWLGLLWPYAALALIISNITWPSKTHSNRFNKN
jgi:VanZ family protein